VPYALSGITSVDPNRVNEILRANLERVIVSHVQASALGSTVPVSLKLLPVQQQSGDIDRLRAYGSYLNALGVISGVLGRKFPPEKRSMALGISAAAGSFGQFAVLPLTQWLLEPGWHGALLTLSAVALLMVPLSAAI
jgi:hypothetical protein